MSFDFYVKKICPEMTPEHYIDKNAVNMKYIVKNNSVAIHLAMYCS